METCKHEWVEDENFKSGAVKMFFGNIGDVKQESRFICKNCGAVDYLVVDGTEVKTKWMQEMVEIQ